MTDEERLAIDKLEARWGSDNRIHLDMRDRGQDQAGDMRSYSIDMTLEPPTELPRTYEQIPFEGTYRRNYAGGGHWHGHITGTAALTVYQADKTGCFVAELHGGTNSQDTRDPQHAWIAVHLWWLG